MILVLIGVCILLAIGGFFIIEKWYYDMLGAILSVCGIIGGILALISLIFLLVDLSQLVTIDEQIAMYQEENANIEQQIETVVKQYQEYESEIFTEVSSDSAITLVSLYPELKSDELVKSQIDIYVNNNEKIKALKEQKIKGKMTRWWVYFG